MSGLPMKEKGEFLENTVGDIFTNWGFEVQKRVRMKDKFDTEHEIDVLATKKEAFGSVVVAIECKYVTAPIDIKELRNFHDKLSTLSITKGIFVSTGGFTRDAEGHASAMGIECWDLATLQDKMGQIQGLKGRIENALPLGHNILSSFFHSQIKNRDAFLLVGKAQIRFYPYYFVEYHCFSQDRAGGELVTLESRGTVVLDAVQGTISDSRLNAGVPPKIPSHGAIAGLFNMNPRTMALEDIPFDRQIFMPEPQVAAFKIKERDAKSIVQREVTKTLSTEHKYFVGSSVRSKSIRPHKKDVEITSCNLFNVPFVSVTLSARNKEYARLLQGVTGAIMQDETHYCLLCKKNPAEAVCETCGTVVCKNHFKQCNECAKPVCDNCVISKGLILKKVYCPQHSSECPVCRTRNPQNSHFCAKCGAKLA